MLVHAVVPENAAHIPEPEGPVVFLAPLGISPAKRSQTLNGLGPGEGMDGRVWQHLLLLHLVLLHPLLQVMGVVIPVVLVLDIGVHKYLKQLIHFAIVVDIVQLVLLLGLDDVHFPEEFVHVLGAELEVLLHLVYPLLVHLFVVLLHQLLNAELECCYFLIVVQVHLHHIPDQQQGQLYLFVVSVGLQLVGHALEVLHIGVQAIVDYLPFHLLQGGPQEQYLQLVQH